MNRKKKNDNDDASDTHEHFISWDKNLLPVIYDVLIVSRQTSFLINRTTLRKSEPLWIIEME